MTKGRWALLLVLLMVGVGAGVALAVSQLGVGRPPQTAPQTTAPLPSEPNAPLPRAAVHAQPPDDRAPLGPGRPTTGGGQDRERLEREIALLRLLAEMGLSREQLQELHAIVADLKAKRDAIVQAQLELRDFLMGYRPQQENGSLKEALRPYEEKVETARRDFREGLQGAVERLKELLTLKQGEVLRDFLLEHFRVPGVRDGEVDEGEIRLWPPEPPFPLPKEGRVELHILGRWEPQDLEDRAAPGGRWEERLERFREELEALPERLERWFAPWDWDVRLEADWEALREKLEALRERWPEWRVRIERRPPRLELRLRGEMPRFAPNALLQRFLAENLDLLEAILAEKLERLGTTQL